MKLGVLGFAHGHYGAYCTRWREDKGLGIDVVAGWDHDDARLKAAGGNHGIEARDSADELLRDRSIEAVLITSETSLHAELAEKAANAKKAIILQKPIALTLEEADRIINAVEKNGVPFTLAWQMRVDPENLKMKELVDSGELGRLFMVRRRHTLNFCLPDSCTSSWHVQAQYNRDIWADDAAHPIDFLYWMLGRPASVTAELGTLLRDSVPNDNGIAIFRYPSGLIAEVVCSFVCRGGENTVEITSENGAVIQNYGDAVTAPLRPEGVPALKWRFAGDTDWRSGEFPVFRNQGERLANLARPLSDFLHGKRPALATARDGREVLRYVIACYESNEKGVRIRLN